jgi:hypothetical protein
MIVGRLGYEALGYEYLGRYYLEIGRPQVARTYFEKAAAKYGRNTDEAREVQVLIDETKPNKPDEKDGKTKQQPQDKGNKQLRLY